MSDEYDLLDILLGAAVYAGIIGLALTLLP
jgi:hypothetical protein